MYAWSYYSRVSVNSETVEQITIPYILYIKSSCSNYISSSIIENLWCAELIQRKMTVSQFGPQWLHWFRHTNTIKMGFATGLLEKYKVVRFPWSLMHQMININIISNKTPKRIRYLYNISVLIDLRMDEIGLESICSPLLVFIKVPLSFWM